MHCSSRRCAVLVAVASMTLPALCAAQAPETVFWFSPDGDDAGTGQENDPFRTLPMAQKAVRDLIEFGMTEDVRVRIHEGRYLLDDTWVFDATDSGRDGFKVTYSGVEGEAQPEIMGASSIALDWTGFYTIPTPGGGELLPVFVADVPKEIEFRTLFAEDQSGIDRLTRARTPNEDYMRAEDGDENLLVYKPGDLPASFDLERANLMCWSRPSPSTNPDFVPVGYFGIDGHDPVTRRLDLDPMFNTIRANDLYWVEGALEFLDARGEWVLEKVVGGPNRLHVIPRQGGVPEEVLIPAVDTVVHLDGVSNLWFEGLDISISDWVKDILVIWRYHQQASVPRAGVLVENSTDVVFAGCRVHNTGADGIRFEGVGERYTVAGCLIEDVGVMGIIAWGLGNELTRDHTFIHNIIRTCGELLPWGGGVVLGGVRDSLVGNNDISDTPRYGIYIRRQASRGNVIERNDIFDVIQGSGDVGGITSWRGRDNFIYNNVIHDVTTKVDHLAKEIGPRGIYLDNRTEDSTVASNLIYGITTDVPAPNLSIQNFILKGTANLIQNNVSVIQGPNGVVSHLRSVDGTCHRVQKNIFFDDGLPLSYQHDGALSLLPDLNCATITQFNCTGAGTPNPPLFAPRYAVVNKNVYWRGEEEDEAHMMSFNNGGLCMYAYDQWQAIGYDVESRFEDPLFEDVAADDYRLLPNSPARDVGFVDIDFVNVGAIFNPFL